MTGMLSRRGRGCVCGHGTDAHRHYRSGSDCCRCDCSAFRRMSLVPWRAAIRTATPDPVEEIAVGAPSARLHIVG